MSAIDIGSLQGGGLGGPEAQEVMAAVAACSTDGEIVSLRKPVELAEGTDVWLKRLESEVGAGIHSGIEAASKIALDTNNLEELAINVICG